MEYTSSEIIKHFETCWGSKGSVLVEGYGPKNKLDDDFKVVEFEPGLKHGFWIYSTAGMSIGRTDGRDIELHVFSGKQDRRLIRALASAASYHRNEEPLGLNHTINLGEPWQDNSRCEYAFISLPYLDGRELEVFENGKGHLHNFWLIPITEGERDYKTKNGWEDLENLFEERQFNYLDTNRESLV